MAVSNKFLIADKSQLLKKKLEKISVKLQASSASGTLQTQEEYLLEAIKVLQEFYKDLKEPILTEQDVTAIHEDDLPDPDLYNKIWSKVIDDLIVVFTELENIENLTLNNFNFITTEANRLTARLKKVSSSLGDYILYTNNPLRDALFFKDSFNDLSKIDAVSPLLNADECDISQTEGIVTLPVNKDEDASILVTEAPLINPNSNGVTGNNQELGADFRGSLSDILDNNPDTWFEYERVVSAIAENQDPLVLDLTINLGEEQVVNFIRINPNNFGTKTVIKILSIDTSLDGKVYTSIKDDIPIGDFITEDEENVFTLAPSTSKFAGQGLYSFTPRKVKYVRLILQQSEPYIIQTAAGQKLRYAIGLRDVELKNQKYKPTGEVVSTIFNLTDEVRKVSIQSNQNPIKPSELTSITWQVSPDDGASWHEIQPIGFPGISGKQTVPEVLEFNGPSENTIETDVPVYSLRVKAILERADGAFEEGSSTLYKNRVIASEVYEIPTTAPFTIDITNPPIDGTLTVIDPLFGSRGIPESSYIVGQSGKDQRKFRLPFKNLPRPMKKVLVNTDQYKTIPADASDWMHVEVGGEEWTQAISGIQTYVLDVDLIPFDENFANQYRLYSFNPATAELEFGNGLNTLSPNDNADISLYFEPERLYPSEADGDHTALLEFSTSNNKADMTMERYGKEQNTTEVLQRKATVIRLKNKNITDYSVLAAKINQMILDATSILGVEKSFINGRDELTANCCWSIDVENGVLYSFVETPDDSDIIVSYKYRPITTLTTDDWDWGSENNLRTSVKIKNSAWKVLDVEDETIAVASGVTAFDVANFATVKDTYVFTVKDSGGLTLTEEDADYPFIKEVTFIDGQAELGKQITKTTESIPALTAGLNTFSLQENILQDSEGDALFSRDDIFVNIKTSAADVTSSGDYHIETNPLSVDYGKVTVQAAAIVSNPGRVTYYFTKATYSDQGLYSIDYRHGRVFTQRIFQAGWTFSVSYSYTDYRAKYRIARALNPTAYDVDIVNRTVTIKDSEVLKRELMPNSGNNYYIINYEYVGETREDIASLKDSFTPTIKDYALKVITKGRIF